MKIKGNHEHMQQCGAPWKIDLRLVDNLIKAIFGWYKTMFNSQGNVRYDIKQCLIAKEITYPRLTTINYNFDYLNEL